MATIRLLGAMAASDRGHDTLGHEASPRRLALIALLSIARDDGVERGQAATLLWRRESELAARTRATPANAPAVSPTSGVDYSHKR